jgi:hypothetical protein
MDSMIDKIDRVAASAVCSIQLAFYSMNPCVLTSTYHESESYRLQQACYLSYGSARVAFLQRSGLRYDQVKGKP